MIYYNYTKRTQEDNEMIFASELDKKFYAPFNGTLYAGAEKLAKLKSVDCQTGLRYAQDIDGRLMGWTNVDDGDFRRAASKGPEAVDRLINRLTKLSQGTKRFDALGSFI